ncbi:hypothetical protein ACFWP7_38490 [Streptomyces sp. NPDC058470]|uniref:hypothetical protein n=1 Tax=Streptomyces sp. NPDC058470 TaxID=3346515 RepID=UPI0036634B70
MLHEIAAILARNQESQARRRAAEHQTADELGTLLATPAATPAAAEGALRACGLPAEDPYRVIVAATGPQRAGLTEGALTEGRWRRGPLTEAVAHARPDRASVGRPAGRRFVAFVREMDAVVREADTVVDTLAEVWPLLAACEPSIPLYGGIGSPAAGPEDLKGALAEAC